MSEFNLLTDGFDMYFKPVENDFLKIELSDARLENIDMSVQRIQNDFLTERGDMTKQFNAAVDYFKDSLKVANAYSFMLRHGDIHDGDANWEQVMHDITLKNYGYRNDKDMLCDLEHITIKAFKYGELPLFKPPFIYDPALLGCVEGNNVYLCGYATNTLLNVFSEKIMTERGERFAFYGFEHPHKISKFKDLIDLN